ncbi:MAG TPA: hypothetical protein VGQ00_00905 [Candidatus Norongarragalinales archaeon]|jgi:hypothetical protein|nr:hypothetical protein [Candidatus Norongarragalinales archaeon]
MRKAIFVFFLAMLATPLLALSPAEADAKAQPLLNDQARDAIRLGQNQPLGYANDRYWVYYLDITTPTQLVVAIRDDDGAVLTDNFTLSALAKLAYHNDQLRLAGVRRASASDYSSFLEALQPTAQDLPQRVDSAMRPLDNKYPEMLLSVTLVPLAQVVHDDWLDATDRTRDALTLQEQFDRSVDSADLELSYNQHVASMDRVDALLKAMVSYQQNVTAKANNATARYSGTNRTEIVQALQSIYNLGDFANAKLRFDSARAEFQSRAGAEDAWSARAVENLFFRNTRAKAIAQYDALKPRVEALFASESTLASAGVDLQALRALWTRIDVTMKQPAATLSEYEVAISNMESAQEQVNEANAKYQSYLRSQQQPTTTTPQADYSLIAIGVVVLAIAGYFAYQYWKKRQEGGGSAEPVVERKSGGGLYG